MAAAKKTTKKAATKKTAAPKGGDRIGRGTRWTEEQVSLLLETVTSSRTAKEAFETVAKQLGKSTGTVQQKYYNLQKKTGASSGRRRGRPAGAPKATAAAATPRAPPQSSPLPTARHLRSPTSFRTPSDITVTSTSRRNSSAAPRTASAASTLRRTPPKTSISHEASKPTEYRSVCVPPGPNGPPPTFSLVRFRV